MVKDGNTELLALYVSRDMELLLSLSLEKLWWRERQEPVSGKPNSYDELTAVDNSRT